MVLLFITENLWKRNFVVDDEAFCRMQVCHDLSLSSWRGVAWRGVAWDGIEVVSRCFLQISGWGLFNLSHLFTVHPSSTRVLFSRRERCIFNNEEQPFG